MTDGKSFPMSVLKAKSWGEYVDVRANLLIKINVPVEHFSLLNKHFRDNLVPSFDNYMLAMMIDNLLLSDYAQQVGPTINLFGAMAVNRAVMDSGGYYKHWKALFYKSRARTLEEYKTLLHWLYLYEDANHAPVGSRVSVEGYQSWEEAKIIARKRLDEITADIERSEDIIEQEWQIPLEEDNASSFVKVLKNEITS